MIGARNLAVLLGILLLVAFVLLVWPTRYRYERFEGAPVRIDRFNGCAELLYTGWIPMTEQCGGSEEEPPSRIILIPSEHLQYLDSLDVRGEFLPIDAEYAESDWHGSFRSLMGIPMQLEIDNGTKCTLRLLEISVTLNGITGDTFIDGLHIPPGSQLILEVRVGSIGNAVGEPLDGFEPESWASASWAVRQATFEVPHDVEPSSDDYGRAGYCI